MGLIVKEINMKKLVLVFAVCSLFAMNAEAQREGRPQGRMNPEKFAERMTDHMAEELSLSGEQRKEVYSLHLERFTQRAEEMKARRERMKAEHRETQEKLQAILTPEQKSKWEEKQSEWRKKGMQPRESKKSMEGRKKRGSFKVGS